MEVSASSQTSKTQRALVVAIALNTALAAGQIVVGLLTRSLAVAADAAHQFVDVIALCVSLLALRATLRPASERRTYGLRRSDAIGALTSSLLLLLSVAWIAYEAVRRLLHPTPVTAGPMIVIGLVGLLINGSSAWLVHRSGADDGHGHAHAEHNHAEHDQAGHGHDDHPASGLSLSARAAWLHLLGDAVGSLIVLVTGVVLTVRRLDRLDSVASLLLCALIIPSTIRLLRQAADVLLDTVPRHLDVNDITQAISETDGVLAVHHLHVWSLGFGENALSAHVEVDGETSVHASQEVINRINAVVTQRFAIGHTTLQVECHPCVDPVHS